MDGVGEPYLSVVVTARNDDHGGNLLDRMQVFVAGWIEQARRFHIPSELIIVEWNPPPDRPRLIDALRWPVDLGCCEVRFIEVPPELHARYPHGGVLPLYQMAAKNAGIRRARGQFVLATNIDILFSDELAEYLAARRLERGRMYRIDRHDAMSDVPPDAPVEEQLAYCATHLLRVNRREGSFNVSSEGHPALSANDVAPDGSGISFGRGWYPPECHVPPDFFRWAGDVAEIHLEAPSEPGLALVLDIEPGPSTGGLPLQLEIDVDGEAATRESLDCRKRLLVGFGSHYPQRLLVRTPGGSVRINRDPRPLNLRVFRVAWERQPKAQAVPAPTLETSLQAAPPAQHAVTLWHALMHLIDKLANGGPLVQLTVPVSPRVRRLLKFYVDRGGLTGMLRHAPSARRTDRDGPAETASPSQPSAVAEASWQAPDFLHTNACGDFTLMAREHWFDLRGYPEMDLFSMNLDSLFCFAAHHGGAREEVLSEPMRIYHIEHGSGWTPEGQAKLFERVAAKGLSFIDNEGVLTMASQMRQWGAPMIFNHEDWGLAAFVLNETGVARRAS